MVYAYRTERNRNVSAVKGIFWPSLWYIVVASRPIGIWLSMWGISLPGGSDDPTEGSVVDRYFFLTLTIVGFRVLSQRNFNWKAAAGENPALVAFLVYMAMSICWSDYAFVSFKRFVKVLGSVVMTFVILTNGDPLGAFTTLLRRCLYIHLPMSIICTRYFRDIGVSFEFNGTTEEWQGISMSKNTLGQVTMLGVVYFAWQVWKNWPRYGWKNLHLLYLLMALYLLKGAKSVSMTSASVSVLALFIFLRIQYLKGRPQAIRSFVMKAFWAIVVLISFVIIHSLVMFSETSFFGHLITMLGRDITLTGRTDIWHDVYAVASRNPLMGVGFGGFWIGRIANIPWNAHMTWVLGQGHSGYVDLYLQLGFIGVGMLLYVFLATFPKLFASFSENFDLACLRITLLITIIYVNMTESVYLRGDHHLWLILMISMWTAPKIRKLSKVRPIQPDVVHLHANEGAIPAPVR